MMIVTRPSQSKHHRHPQDRLKKRQTLSLDWLRSETRQQLKELHTIGVYPMRCRRCIRGSRSWCWRWLLSNGYGSRAVSCRRRASPERMAVAITNFGHFLRAIVLKRGVGSSLTGSVTATASGTGSSSVSSATVGDLRVQATAVTSGNAFAQAKGCGPR